MKKIVSILLLSATLIVSCKQKTEIHTVPNVKGFDLNQLLDSYGSADSVTRITMIESYLDSVKILPSNEDRLSNDIVLYEKLMHYFGSSNPGSKKRVSEHIANTYRSVFDTLKVDLKVWYIFKLKEIIPIQSSQLDSVLDEFESCVEKTHSSSKLPNAWFLDDLLSSDGLYRDEIRRERIRKKGSVLILKEFVPKLQKATTLAALDTFYHNGSFYYDEINEMIQNKKDSLYRQIESSPFNYSLSTLMLFLDTKDCKNTILLAELVKKAKTYDECVRLMDEYIPVNTPVWRACDTKAQKLLGLNP